MIYILLPAYNEEESIDAFFSSIDDSLTSVKQDYHVIVCNDGSTDKTSDKLALYSAKMPLTVIHHQYNRGLGETMRDLFEKALEVANDEDMLIRMDCDSTHEPKYIQQMIQKLREGYDVVIASRFEKGGGQEGLTLYRKFMSRCATLFMKSFFPVPGLKEYTCGFRAYRARIIKDAINFYGNDFIQLKGLGFTCTLEKIVKLKILKARIGEVPFVLRYDKKLSSSKMISSVTTFGYFTLVLLYYWPWGGWRRAYRKKLQAQRKDSNSEPSRPNETAGKHHEPLTTESIS